jgi:hypothetical protein
MLYIFSAIIKTYRETFIGTTPTQLTLSATSIDTVFIGNKTPTNLYILHNTTTTVAEG